MELLIGAIVIGIFAGIINSVIKKEEINETFEENEEKRKNQLQELIENRKERIDLTLYDNEKFWDLIDSTRNQANGSYSNQLGLLNDRLLQLTASELIQFDNKLQHLHLEAHNWDLMGISVIIFKSNDLDSLFTLESWLISRGEIIFNNCLVNHEQIVNHDFKDINGRLLIDVIAEVYYKKTNEFIPVFPNQEIALAGNEWTEKELPSRFNQIWKKFA
jgi:hypothetical protein